MGLRDLAAAIAPTWLQGEVGEKYLYAQSVVVDATADRVLAGVHSYMPEKCDPSCLPYIGRDRSVIRGINETDASYAHRCKTAIYDWHFAGLGEGIMSSLLGYLSPSAPLVRVVWAAHGTYLQPTQWEWVDDGDGPAGEVQSFSTMHPGGYAAEWHWDTIDNRRRFWVILYVNTVGDPWVAETGYYDSTTTYGDGEAYGITGISTEQCQTLLNIIKTFKSAHSRCEQVVICFDSTLLDPFNMSGTYPSGYNNTLPTPNWASYGYDSSGYYSPGRSASCRFLGGVG